MRYRRAVRLGRAYEQVQRALRQAGVVARPLSRQELAGWIRAWKQQFAGADTPLPFLWSVFTADNAIAARRDKAIRAYHQAAQAAQDFVALSAGPQEGWGLAWSHGVLPPLTPCDVVIAPTDLSWTLAFSHHHELGPYFASAPTPPEER